jgi:membrane associated rhomboid family serine protease
MFMATIVFMNSFGIDLTRRLGLHYPAAPDFKVWQFVTYMFMHGGFTHIFFNMFALWMFGNVLENVWGSQRFLTYYIATGIGAGLTYIVWIHFHLGTDLSLINRVIADPSLENLNNLLTHHKFLVGRFSGAIWNDFVDFKQSYEIYRLDPTNHLAAQKIVTFLSEYRNYFLNQHVVVGASGAVFGLLLAFGMMFPNSLIYVYFAIPVKAKWFVIIYGAMELFSGISNRPGDNVAHFAHLGGMIFGYFIIRMWKKQGKLY